MFISYTYIIHGSRYQGFSCRYRAVQPNGIAVPGSFGNTSENTKPKATSNSFMQVVQCPQVGECKL